MAHRPFEIDVILRHRLRLGALVVCAIATTWAVGVWLTGGFVLDYGFLYLSSRNPRASSMIAIISGAIAWALGPSGQRNRALADDVERLARHPISPHLIAATAGLVAALSTVVALTQGAFIAGGSDSYGYVSQADLWANGTLRVAQPVMSEVTFPHSDRAWTPLGYRPAIGQPAIVPVYGPGLPLLMAFVQRVGGRNGAFVVVPLLAGLAVWCTYLLGTRLAGRLVGLSAAMLLASSPVFLFQSLQPVSDVPATACWTLSLVLLLSHSRAAALGGGAAAGLAILIRPNLVVLGIAPGGWLLWQALRARKWSDPAVQRLWMFVGAVLPFGVVLGILNTTWYGSPLANGYGPFDTIYDLDNVWPNLTRYPRWLLADQTPMVLLSLAAPFVLTRLYRPGTRPAPATVVMACVFVVVTLACYVAYIPFDSPSYLRFLLPAFPLILVFAATSLTAIVDRLASPLRVIATMVVVSVLAWRGAWSALEQNLFAVKDRERKYAAIGAWIAERLPERAVVISVLYSGSIRYYADRLTMQWAWIPETEMDAVVAALEDHGYPVYFVMEPAEREEFRMRYEGRSRFARLDWAPRATLRHDSQVSIYDPRDRALAEQGHALETEIID